ncbi:MAG: T9SS type A sorting domain-containing protein [Winogradskyella sp.]|uniref:T9SS type A sorting domain-containing protein n=1 Tax=Winogradskyella sp. TaxID=1883156 RepID=UPI003858DF57
MKLKFILALSLMCSLMFAQQIPDEIKPPSWSLNTVSELVPHKLPAFDLKKLQAEDVINDQNKSIPWRFGHDIYVDHDFNDVGEWRTLDNGDRIWRMAYTSKDAQSINFLFDVFKIPEGAKLYVYNEDKTDLLRPFTHHNNNAEEVLGTWLVKGNTAYLEYYQPANVVGEAKLTVGSVVHGYRTAEDYAKGLGDSGACNQDVDCDITPPSDPFGLNTVKENIKKSSALVLRQGTDWCSGTLVNNTNNDGTPYFMTANHCGGGEGTWAFRFNWRSPSPSCSTFAASPNGSFNQTVSGATIRATSSQSDMELVEINDMSFFNNNPDVVWAGWNRSTTQTPVVNFGIHHPSGDIQKVCREDDGAYRAVVNFNGNSNTQMWFIDEWELGVTEPGSSGSALFNETGHLIGMLSGGSAACSGTSNNGGVDFYGRFGVAWDFGSSQATRVREWLDPSNSGVVVLDQFPPLETFDNDARATAGNNSTEICGEDFAPEVTILNPGNLNLTSANVSYFLDSDAPTAVSWSGNLATGESDIVATPTYSDLSPGPHSFTINVSNPNGTTDQNTSNDSFIFNFEVSPSFVTSNLVFNILTDNYGIETTWNVVDGSGNIIAAGPSTPYTNATTFQENITLPVVSGECYTFTIFDDADDGICCGQFGNGNYNLQDDSGNVIITGGQFGSSESVLFNIQNPLNINEFDLSRIIQVYPNPVTDILTIDMMTSNDDVTYNIYNTLGQTVGKGILTANAQHVMNMSEYESGIYFVKLSTTTSAMTQKLIKN